MKYQFIPKIEEKEFKERRRILRSLMEKKEIDVVIAYADDKATFGQQFSRYYFNYQPHFESCCIIIPMNQKSFIVTGPESEEFVYKNSFCSEVKIADVFTHPNEEYPFHKIQSFTEILLQFSNEKNLKKIRVGIAGSEMLPFKYWQKINDIDFVNIIEVDDMILKQRSIKSSQEIKVIEHAYKIAEKGMKKGIEITSKDPTNFSRAKTLNAFLVDQKSVTVKTYDEYVNDAVTTACEILETTTHKLVPKLDIVFENNIKCFFFIYSY